LIKPALVFFPFFSQFDNDELETIPLTHDSNQLESCVGQLRDLLGPLIPQDQLVRVALAADYDVNRAANYFFNSEYGGGGGGGES
jgi:hypothetical protein